MRRHPSDARAAAISTSGAILSLVNEIQQIRMQPVHVGVHLRGHASAVDKQQRRARAPFGPVQAGAVPCLNEISERAIRVGLPGR